MVVDGLVLLVGASGLLSKPMACILASEWDSTREHRIGEQ